MIINLSNIGSGGGGSYVLPTATASRLGGVKIGSGIAVENDGTISVSGGTMPDMSGYTTTAVTAELSAATSGLAVDLAELNQKVPNAVVLNLLTNEERKALYDEINPYFINGNLSSGFPVDKYEFFYWAGDRKIDIDNVRGFVRLDISKKMDGIVFAGNAGVVPVLWTGNYLYQVIYSYKIDSSGNGSLLKKEVKPYTLPTAAANTLGGVKVGSGLTIDGNGVLSVSGGSSNVKTYVLNLMSQQERATLYTELVQYKTSNNEVSSGFPVEDYQFYVFSTNSNDYKGFVPVELALFSTDYGGSIFFTGLVADRNNYSKIIKTRYIITSDGGTDQTYKEINTEIEIVPLNYSWLGQIKYDAENSQFLRGDTVLDPTTSYEGFESSSRMDELINQGMTMDQGASNRVLTPVLPIRFISGGTTYIYSNPTIVGVDITSVTIDGQTYSRQYSFIYTREDGNRFIIKMKINGNQSATGFEYIAI